LPPPTVEAVARQVIAAVDSDAGYLLASQWVCARLQEISTRVKMRHLRKVGELIMPGAITTGTCTFTQHNNVVTADATATAVWGAQHIGWHIRGNVSWYEIVEYQKVGGFGTFYLKNLYEEDPNAVSTVGAYTLVQRYLPLDPNAQFISRVMIHMRRRYPMTMITLDELETIAPSRPRVGWGPDTFVQAPSKPDGTMQVECYPYATQDESLRYIYWEYVPTYNYTDPLPPRMSAYALKEGALIDLYRYKGAKCLDNKDFQGAATWFNMSRSQETIWENKYIRQLIASDRSDDDATFILRRANTPIRAFDIQTAQDEIYSRWPR